MIMSGEGMAKLGRRVTPVFKCLLFPRHISMRMQHDVSIDDFIYYGVSDVRITRERCCYSV
jgi:hypothetical protein